MGAWAKSLTATESLGARVRACPMSDWAVFCLVESSFLRSFQRQRMCCDQSLVAGEPRVAASPFGDESTSWQRRQSDF